MKIQFQVTKSGQNLQPMQFMEVLICILWKFYTQVSWFVFMAFKTSYEIIAQKKLWLESVVDNELCGAYLIEKGAGDTWSNSDYRY